MKVFIVFRNDKIDKVFTTAESAKEYIKTIAGWNIWKTIEMNVS